MNNVNNMKSILVETGLSQNLSDRTVYKDRKEAFLSRQAERKKLERNGSLLSNMSEVERFTDAFNEKQSKIEAELDRLKGMNPEDQGSLGKQIGVVSKEIHELQKLFSNSTFFLRVYDKRVFKNCIQELQGKLQSVEKKMVPKKKFGFKVKKRVIEGGDLEEEDEDEEEEEANESEDISEVDSIALGNLVGISGRSNEELSLVGEEIDGRNVVLKDLTDCCVWLKGVPSTLHATNIHRCKMFFGPVITSVFVESVTDSSWRIACQQLRIHETTNSDFYVHVTSKSIIENCKNVRFGKYNLDYDGIDDDYEMSGLNRDINNWDQVDDFNWLVNKQSPNWSLIAPD